MRKFTLKSSDLRTCYLPEGQTDAEVFVKRNIHILSIYAVILYLFQFQNKNGRFPVCLPVTAHVWNQKVMHVHSCYSITKNARFFY